jgi:hypothetical protein
MRRRIEKRPARRSPTSIGGVLLMAASRSPRLTVGPAASSSGRGTIRLLDPREASQELAGDIVEARPERVHVSVLEDLLADEPQASLEGRRGARVEERRVEAVWSPRWYSMEKLIRGACARSLARLPQWRSAWVQPRTEPARAGRARISCTSATSFLSSRAR